MGEREISFKRIQKIIEISSGLLIVSGLLIINLPLVPTPDKTTVYLASIFVFVFIFLWHKLSLSINLMNKNFIESVVLLAVIFVIVHATGGTSSYFNFLYLLPNLSVATSSSRWYTFGSWLATAGFIFGEALLFPSAQVKPVGSFSPPDISLAVLNVWAVGLVAVYGRYLAKEVETTQVVATEATVEKEKEINTLKDEFLFIISHELRGPITAIRGYLELFLTTDSTKTGNEVKRLTLSAMSQGELLNDLIAQLLDLSRLEVGKLKLANENFEINEYLAQLLKNEQEAARGKGIELMFKETTQKVSVYADKERAREVVHNLVDNAIKYTRESGKVWVWVEARGGSAYISVADTGVGIVPQDLPGLFDRFHQPTENPKGEPNGTKKEKSVGLGLFLAKNLVEKMNGKIFAESRLGKGTKFTFSLPLAKN